MEYNDAKGKRVLFNSCPLHANSKQTTPYRPVRRIFLSLLVLNKVQHSFIIVNKNTTFRLRTLVLSCLLIFNKWLKLSFSMIFFMNYTFTIEKDHGLKKISRN